MGTLTSCKEGGQTEPCQGVDVDTAQHEKSQNRITLSRPTTVREIYTHQNLSVHD